MGFIFGCLLLGMVGVFVWGFITKADERKKALAEYQENPAGCLFVVVWIACCLTTFVGVFVPVLGSIKVFNSGWELWQVTGIASLVGFIIYMTPLGRKL